MCLFFGQAPEMSPTCFPFPDFPDKVKMVKWLQSRENAGKNHSQDIIKINQSVNHDEMTDEQSPERRFAVSPTDDAVSLS